jgi:hypothetical protein
MKARKLANFEDKNLDLQIVEIIGAINDKVYNVNGPCTDLASAIVLINQLRAVMVARSMVV